MNGVNSNGINRAAPVMMPVSAYDLPPEDWETESMIPPATAVSSGSDSAMTPSMSESLDQRKRETIARCIEEAKRLNKKLLFGMTTSLVLQSVPLPVDCDLDESLLHTVSSAKNKRIRVKNSPLCTHIWKHWPERVSWKSAEMFMRLIYSIHGRNFRRMYLYER